MLQCYMLNMKVSFVMCGCLNPSVRLNEIEHDDSAFRMYNTGQHDSLSISSLFQDHCASSVSEVGEVNLVVVVLVKRKK